MTRREGDGFIGTYGTCIALVVLFVAFAASAPNFLASANLLNILRQASFLAILATGFTLALVVAELDLSFANAFSLAAVCMGALVVFLLFTKMLPEALLITPYFRLMSELGPLNTHLALILAYSSFALPFRVWMLIGFFRSIPREIDEAAIVDGASRPSAFFRLILPLARPGLVAVALFTFLISWNAYVGRWS
ncbi:MAG: ABC transporter permease subunit [Alphaproteobacteria bacterium]|nr:ABC transporter permease subunit [Alphaproteobacteria bacterium]MBM3630058.1 ABC transporter permease subunit [Alphaproteobacteria bacterium]